MTRTLQEYRAILAKARGMSRNNALKYLDSIEWVKEADKNIITSIVLAKKPKSKR